MGAWEERERERDVGFKKKIRKIISLCYNRSSSWVSLSLIIYLEHLMQVSLFLLEIHFLQIWFTELAAWFKGVVLHKFWISCAWISESVDTTYLQISLFCKLTILKRGAYRFLGLLAERTWVICDLPRQSLLLVGIMLEATMHRWNLSRSWILRVDLALQFKISYT